MPGKANKGRKGIRWSLCIQDTTELDFTSQPGIAGLGRLSYEAQHGLYAHLMLMATPQGLALPPPCVRLVVVSNFKTKKI
jgi:hypothetical protein